LKTFQDFSDEFRFNPELTLCVGTEREIFVANAAGQIVPMAEEVLKVLHNQNWCVRSSIDHIQQFGYELSACQIESRTKPCELVALGSELKLLQSTLDSTLNSMGLSSLYCEVAPDDMPLDVFPDPCGRYQEISREMTRDVLLAACQVIGTHFHVGMPDHETALRVYNRVIKSCRRLCELGDGSAGKRLEIYSQVARNPEPQAYATWEDFYKFAVANDFVDDPRDCWSLIRLTRYGTIEFRMFGATDSVDTVLEWAKTCYSLCEDAME